MTMNNSLSEEKQQTLRQAMTFSQMAYYGAFVLAVVAVGVSLLLIKNGCCTPVSKETLTVVKTLSYLYLLLSIPFALWYFSRQVRSLQTDDLSLLLKQYRRLVLLRVVLIATGFVGNILLFYLCQTVPVTYDFLFAAAIAAVALLFCKPKRQTVEYELFPPASDGDA